MIMLIFVMSFQSLNFNSHHVDEVNTVSSIMGGLSLYEEFIKNRVDLIKREHAEFLDNPVNYLNSIAMYCKYRSEPLSNTPTKELIDPTVGLMTQGIRLSSAGDMMGIHFYWRFETFGSLIEFVKNDKTTITITHWIYKRHRKTVAPGIFYYYLERADLISASFVWDSKNQKLKRKVQIESNKPKNDFGDILNTSMGPLMWSTGCDGIVISNTPEVLSESLGALGIDTANIKMYREMGQIGFDPAGFMPFGLFRKLIWQQLEVTGAGVPVTQIVGNSSGGKRKRKEKADSDNKEEIEKINTEISAELKNDQRLIVNTDTLYQYGMKHERIGQWIPNREISPLTGLKYYETNGGVRPNPCYPCELDEVLRDGNFIDIVYSVDLMRTDLEDNDGTYVQVRDLIRHLVVNSHRDTGNDNDSRAFAAEKELRYEILSEVTTVDTCDNPIKVKAIRDRYLLPISPECPLLLKIE